MLDLKREFEGLIRDPEVLDEYSVNKLFPLLQGNPDAVFKPTNDDRQRKDP